MDQKNPISQFEVWDFVLLMDPLLAFLRTMKPTLIADAIGVGFLLINTLNRRLN